jgi:hypothetical protein
LLEPRPQRSQRRPDQEPRGTQAFDCLALLAPPLRLATIAFVAARDSLQKNVPETVARLTGGEYFKLDQRQEPGA